MCSLLGSSKLMYARSDKVFWAWGWNSLQTQRTFPQILKSYCWCILWCGKSPIVDLPIISHKKKYFDFLLDIVDGSFFDVFSRKRKTSQFWFYIYNCCTKNNALRNLIFLVFWKINWQLISGLLFLVFKKLHNCYHCLVTEKSNFCSSNEKAILLSDWTAIHNWTGFFTPS